MSKDEASRKVINTLIFLALRFFCMRLLIRSRMALISSADMLFSLTRLCFSKLLGLGLMVDLRFKRSLM